MLHLFACDLPDGIVTDHSGTFGRQCMHLNLVVVSLESAAPGAAQVMSLTV